MKLFINLGLGLIISIYSVAYGFKLLNNFINDSALLFLIGIFIVPIFVFLLIYLLNKYGPFKLKNGVGAKMSVAEQIFLCITVGSACFSLIMLFLMYSEKGAGAGIALFFVFFLIGAAVFFIALSFWAYFRSRRKAREINL